MEHVRLCAIWPIELGSSLNQIQGWIIVREYYFCALEQGTLVRMSEWDGGWTEQWGDLGGKSVTCFYILKKFLETVSFLLCDDMNADSSPVSNYQNTKVQWIKIHSFFIDISFPEIPCMILLCTLFETTLYRVIHPVRHWVGLTLVWLFHSLPHSVWAGGKLAELAEQACKIVEYQIKVKPYATVLVDSAKLPFSNVPKAPSPNITTFWHRWRRSRSRRGRAGPTSWAGVSPR